MIASLPTRSTHDLTFSIPSTNSFPTRSIWVASHTKQWCRCKATSSNSTLRFDAPYRFQNRIDSTMRGSSKWGCGRSYFTASTLLGSPVAMKFKHSYIYLPPQIFTSAEEFSDLSVGVFHHPYNWLNAGNHLHFKSYVENHVDLALTGHEHTPGGARQLALEGQTLDYFQAGALQDPDSDVSTFQTLSVDFDQTQQTLK